MDNNQPQNKPGQSVEGFGTQPQQPTQPAPAAPAAPVAQPGQPAPKPQAPVAGQPAPRQSAPRKVLSKEELIQREKGRNKKMLIGCGGAFGCGTILLLVLVFVFVGSASAGTSSLATALGINQQQLINTLVLIVNLFFGVSALVAFVLSIGGIFKSVMARKDDVITKRKGYIMSGSAFGLLIIIIALWIGAWFYLTSQKPQVEVAPQGFITVPEETLNLTAPIEITFDASDLPYDSRSFDIISYVWDFGDGSSGPGTNVETHTFETKGDGRYDVSLTLTFKNKTSGEESSEKIEHIVTIANEEVSAIMTASKSNGPVPLTVDFDGSESSDPDGKIEAYAWEIEGGGFKDGEATFSHTFDQVGTYTVRLRVTNTNGDYAITEEDIIVTEGIEPVAAIDILNADGDQYYADKTYTFDAANSISPVGTIVAYEWDFGDGTSKKRTRTAQHSFSTEGNYRVVLTVTDDDNNTDSAELQMDVDIAPSSPKAVMITNPEKADADDNFIEGTIPFEVNFDATSSTDPDDDIVDYKWDFDGDGEYDAVGETVNYTFSEAGNYTVNLIVIDSAGFEGKSVLLVKAMSRGLEAVVTADPVSGVVPLTVSFDATGSSYSDGKVVSYEWDFGDGTPRRSDIGEVTYKYTKIGNFTVTVKVRTDDNQEESMDILISVRQVPLKSCFEPSRTTGDAPLVITFNPGCSTGTVAKYRWNFGDSETSMEHKPNHTFEAPGTYEVVLEVLDAQNVVDTSSQFITVTGTLTTQ